MPEGHAEHDCPELDLDVCFCDCNGDCDNCEECIHGYIV